MGTICFEKGSEEQFVSHINNVFQNNTDKNIYKQIELSKKYKNILNELKRFRFLIDDLNDIIYDYINDKITMRYKIDWIPDQIIGVLNFNIFIVSDEVVINYKKYVFEYILNIKCGDHADVFMCDNKSLQLINDCYRFDFNAGLFEKCDLIKFFNEYMLMEHNKKDYITLPSNNFTNNNDYCYRCKKDQYVIYKLFSYDVFTINILDDVKLTHLIVIFRLLFNVICDTFEYYFTPKNHTYMNKLLWH
jgi:hypothetical protein